MKRQTGVLVGFSLVVIIVIFSALNTNEVSLSLGFATIKAPLIFIILGSTTIGALIVMLTWMSNYFKQRKELKRLKSTVEELQHDKEKQLDNAMIEERSFYERELTEKSEEIESLNQQLRDLHGETFAEIPYDHND